MGLIEQRQVTIEQSQATIEQRQATIEQGQTTIEEHQASNTLYVAQIDNRLSDAASRFVRIENRLAGDALQMGHLENLLSGIRPQIGLTEARTMLICDMLTTLVGRQVVPVGGRLSGNAYTGRLDCPARYRDSNAVTPRGWA